MLPVPLVEKNKNEDYVIVIFIVKLKKVVFFYDGFASFF